jgi:drug/metabolite transporter (DMT)-like permease
MKKAAFILVLCCLLWGYSFPVLQLAMKALRELYWQGREPVAAQALGLTGAFLGWRFTLAALMTLAFLPSTWRGYTRNDVRSGMILGTLFAAGMLCQLGGLQFVLPSVSSFLTSLTVIFTPLTQALILRRSVSGWTWAGVGLAMAGVGVLSIPNPDACAECSVMEKPPIPYLGEMLSTLGAVIFTMQILALDRFGARCNSRRLTLVNFVTTSVICSQFGLLLCGRALYRQEVIGALFSNGKFLILLVTLTLVSSVLAVHLMNRYQHEVTPAVASVIYTTESIFATIFSLLFGTERLTATTVIGGVLLMGAFAAVTLPGNEKHEEVEL